MPTDASTAVNPWPGPTSGRNAANQRYVFYVRMDHARQSLVRRAHGERLGLVMPDNVERLAAMHLRHVTPGIPVP